MTSTSLHLFLSGALACACVVVALFFAKYWRVTRDRFFLLFGAAFLVMGCNWTAVAVIAPTDETRHYFYLVRLGAFLLILAGIVDKNRNRQG